MTPQEFKSWFDGFTEGQGVPSEERWERIKARVAEIDGTPVTYTTYVDRHWPTYYRPYYGPMWGQLGGGSGGAGGGLGIGGTGLCGGSLSDYGKASNQQSGANDLWSNNTGNQGTNFNSGHAMYALGKADSESLNS